jgi:hypothetical protein
MSHERGSVRHDEPKRTHEAVFSDLCCNEQAEFNNNARQLHTSSPYSPPTTSTRPQKKIGLQPRAYPFALCGSETGSHRPEQLVRSPAFTAEVLSVAQPPLGDQPVAVGW